MKRREFLKGGVALPGLLLAVPAGTREWDRAGERMGPGGGRADDRFEEVVRLVDEKMAEHRVPGVALGVLKDGQLLLRGFGVTSVENPQPVTPDTIFQLASLSKTVTTTAVMRLVEQGRIDLEAPIRRYIPGFRVRDETVSREVTPWHLLTHTPGWESQLATRDLGTETLADLARSMSGLTQLAPLGAVWSYNNPGWALAGHLIEVVTGTDIHQALQDLVFAPLGLTRASTRLGDIVTHRVALGHRPGVGGATEVVRPFAMGSSTTAGGVTMSLADLMSYAAFHLGDDRADVLSRATREAMRVPQVPKHGTPDQMGLGWHLRTLNGVTTAAHGGTAPAGHRLHLQLVPARNLAFAILTNHVDGWRLLQPVEQAVLRVYEGLALGPGQPLSNRGVNELVTGHASALAVQPSPAPYLGSYQRPPEGPLEVRVRNGKLMVDDTDIAFYGPDVAFTTSGAGAGAPYEFIRQPDGAVGWIRVGGRIARKATA